jgi:hypothetical protein
LVFGFVDDTQYASESEFGRMTLLAISRCSLRRGTWALSRASRRRLGPHRALNA